MIKKILSVTLSLVMILSFTTFCSAKTKPNTLFKEIKKVYRASGYKNSEIKYYKSDKSAQAKQDKGDYYILEGLDKGKEDINGILDTYNTAKKKLKELKVDTYIVDKVTNDKNHKAYTIFAMAKKNGIMQHFEAVYRNGYTYVFLVTRAKNYEIKNIDNELKLFNEEVEKAQKNMNKIFELTKSYCFPKNDKKIKTAFKKSVKKINKGDIKKAAFSKKGFKVGVKLTKKAVKKSLASDDSKLLSYKKKIKKSGKIKHYIYKVKYKKNNKTSYMVLVCSKDGNGNYAFSGYNTKHKKTYKKMCKFLPKNNKKYLKKYQKQLNKLLRNKHFKSEQY